MIVLLLLALSILGLLVWRAMDKARDTDVTGIIMVALAAIVTLVLTYVALRVVPPEAVPDLLHGAFTALRAA
ncbi:hypothetical protein [Streptomyces hawaiiensis]|uniref:hypothetical protein n=1 Tax=Streptomyces hawaiiensis TaxID=67305 RepID=UPI00364ADD3D